MGTRKLALLASGLALISVSPVWAESITFDFTDCNSIISSHLACPGSLGASTATFSDTTGAFEVQVTGLDPNEQPTGLAMAFNGFDQNGLGLDAVAGGQVGFGPALSIDLSGLSRLGAYGGTLTLEDMMDGEEAMACTTTGGCVGLSGSPYPPIAQAPVLWSAADQSLSIFVPYPSGGSFLLGSFSVDVNPVQAPSPVPEPGTAPLFALGLSGLILMAARRRRPHAG